jgi:ACS family allantoate permease-like MFS transporter
MLFTFLPTSSFLQVFLYWEFGLTNVTLVVGKITSFGYTPEQSLLYGTPAGAVEVVALLLNGYMGDRTGQRILCSLGGLLTATIGVVLIVALPLENNIGRLIGYYMTQAFPTSFVALLSLISSNVAGYTKKTTVAALYLIGYCAGNIIGESALEGGIFGSTIY